MNLRELVVLCLMSAVVIGAFAILAHVVDSGAYN